MADGPVCARCKVTSSLMWEKNKEGEVLCLECYSNSIQEPANSRGAADQPSLSNRETAADSGFTGRRTRLRNAKGRYGKAPEKTKIHAASSASASPTPTNGNPPQPSSTHRKGGGSTGRRSLAKLVAPNKAPSVAASIITSDSILHKV